MSETNYKPLSLGKAGLGDPVPLNNSKDSAALNSNESNFMANAAKQGRQTKQSNHSSIDDLDNMLLQNQTSMGQKSGATNDQASMKLDLYNRLLAAGVIKASSQAAIDNQAQTVALDPETASRFLNGVTFSKYLLVLKEVVRQVNQDFAVSDSVVNLNPQNTPQARLANWNKICEELDKIAIIVEADQKSLYIAGDSESIGTLFFRIENYLRRISQSDVNELLKSYRPGQKKADRPLINVKPGVDIMQMDVSRSPTETESTLEFILNTLCRALSMKPKQSAALLTNNNQYLTHCMVKGVKGQFEPMLNWYNDIFTNSQHLAWMLEAEVDQAMDTDDPKQIKSSQLNFDKVLQTLSCGCYSPNFQVANTCMKVLAVIGEDFGKNVHIANLAMKWFESQDNGVFTLNYAFKRHFELAEDFVTCIGHFTGGGDQMSWTYMNFLSNFYPDLVDYFGCLSALFPFLEKKFRSDLVDGNLLQQFVERCCRFADFDPQNNAEVRKAALCLLTEIWLCFSKEKQLDEYVSLIQQIYKKNSKDRTRSVRLVTAVNMFNLLDKFSGEKNASAPALYKSLIFSLVENPIDETVRELYLTNFSQLFRLNESIPIRMLIEPLVKSNQLEDLFQFQTFDYDFLALVARHPRLKVDNAIQILDMLARQYHNDICSSSAIAVPFMIICQRFLGDPSCQEFIFKFMEICLNQLLNLELANQDLTSNGFNDKGKVLALPPPKPVGASPKGPRNFKITSSKKNQREQPKELVSRVPVKEDQVNARLKKSLTVNLLLRLQSLIVPVVNSHLQSLCMRAQRQFKSQSGGYLHNGIMAILKFYGDPDRLFNQYLQEQQKIEAEASPPYSNQPYGDRRMLGYESDDKAFSKKNPPVTMLSGTKSQKSLKGAGRNSIALMPITENQQNLRALHELELIRKYKREKEDEELRKQEDHMKRQSQLDQHLKEELRRRRVEKGVPRNVNGVKQELKAVIYNSNGPGPSQFSRKAKAMDKEVSLIDLTQEEERDREVIREYMRRHAKIWRYLFTRYANQCYSSKGKQDFDDLKQKISQVNMGEINKMLKEHNTYPQLISKEEVQALVRQINYRHPAEASVGDIQQLEYSQFLHFIPQLAFICFQRPPIDKSNFPPVECLRTLIAHFEKATKEKGLPTQLFEDPEASGFQDKELIQALEAEVAQDPDFEMPEGFKKQVIKIPNYDFSIPDCARAVMKESQVVATEVMDEMLFDVLGIHFLEPKVSFITQTKVKPVISKKKMDFDPLNYMKKSIKKTPAQSKDKKILEEKKEKAGISASALAAQQRKEALEIKPKLTLPLKLLVTKQDQKNRPQFNEVAEVLEEMFQACEKGLDKLPPRLTRAPGQLQNEAKEQREQRELEERLQREEKENKRKQRDERVKKKIKDSNFGGREMPLHEYQRLKEKTEKEAQDKLDKRQRKEFQKLAKQQHDEVELKKNQNLEALKKKREEDEDKATKEARVAEQITKDFLKKQKTHLKDTFKDTSKRRDDLILRQEEQKNMEKNNEKRLKDQMESFIKETKDDREGEKQERKAISEFLSKPPVAEVFNTYQRPLQQMFKFYASQDSKKDVTAFNVAYLHSVLSFRELVRFGYQQAILPELITGDDMVFVYKHLIREQNEEKPQTKTEQNIGAGMLDYEAFKKAIVRIAIIAQEKLGDGDGDKLQKKLKDDKLKEDKLKGGKEDSAIKKQPTQLQRKQTVAEQKKKQEIDKLREQFHEEQEYKEKERSRAPKVREGDKKKKPREPTENEKRRKAEKQYQIDQAKLEQEETFFQKWMKQRENLGVLAHDVAARDRQETEETGRTLNGSIKKKDLTQKELENLAKQLKEESKMAKMKVQNKQVRKELDASKIDEKTIEAFIKWLGLEEEDSEQEVNKKLNETLLSRKTTILDKKKAGLDASGVNKSESYLETPQKKSEK